jgi:hypothetical protein
MKGEEYLEQLSDCRLFKTVLCEINLECSLPRYCRCNPSCNGLLNLYCIFTPCFSDTPFCIIIPSLLLSRMVSSVQVSLSLFCMHTHTVSFPPSMLRILWTCFFFQVCFVLDILFFKFVFLLFATGRPGFDTLQESFLLPIQPPLVGKVGIYLRECQLSEAQSQILASV